LQYPTALDVNLRKEEGYPSRFENASFGLFNKEKSPPSLD